MNKPFSMPLGTCDAEIRSASEDQADDVVDIIVSTGAGVRRYDWANSRYYMETLDVSKDAVNLQRLNSGAPLLNTHQSYTLEDQIGKVQNPEIRGGKLYAQALLSSRESVSGLVKDIKRGVISNVSVGYSRDQIEMIPPSQQQGTWEYRVKKWTPFEVSFVPIPADAGAHSMRSESEKNFPCEVINFETREAEIMNQDQDQKDQLAMIEAEQKRSADIIDLCVKHGMAQRASEYIKSGKTVQDVGLEILNSKVAADSSDQRNITQVKTVRDEHETRMAGIQEALSHRLNYKEQLTDNGKRFRGYSLIEIGREYLHGIGIRTDGMAKHDIAGKMLTQRSSQGMHSTSDFPLLLSALVNKRLRAAYEEAPATFRTWARRGTNAPDFKNKNILMMSNAPDLLQVNEHGEFKYGSFSEGGETYSVATYGRIVSLTRQAIINDDLGAFDTLVTRFGGASERLQNSLVYAQLTSNPTLSDTGALFNSNAVTTTGGHANLLSGGSSALSFSSLDSARKSMQLQRGMANETLNLNARYLLVPAALRTTAEQLMAQNYMPNTQSNINVFAGQYVVVSDAILDGSSSTAWYMLADNGMIDTVEYCYLDGAEGPVVESEIGFDTDGVSYKVRLDFGCKAIDFRGMIKSNGV